MNLDWQSLDRWMMGEAWTGSRIQAHLAELCDRIGPRWSSSDAEWEAIHYLREQMERDGLEQAAVEEFPLDTWAWSRAEARVVEEGRLDRRAAVQPVPAGGPAGTARRRGVWHAARDRGRARRPARRCGRDGPGSRALYAADPRFAAPDAAGRGRGGGRCGRGNKVGAADGIPQRRRLAGPGAARAPAADGGHLARGRRAC